MGRLRPAGLAEIFHPDGGRGGSSLEDGLDGVSRSSLHPEALLARQAARRRDAALGVAVGALILGVAAFVAILSIQPAQARSPRSPTQVERIMRVANQRAEENQRAARAAPSLLKPQDLLRWGSRPLMTVAESPGASDVEGSEAGSLKKR